MRDTKRRILENKKVTVISSAEPKGYAIMAESVYERPHPLIPSQFKDTK